MVKTRMANLNKEDTTVDRLMEATSSLSQHMVNLMINSNNLPSTVTERHSSQCIVQLDTECPSNHKRTADTPPRHHQRRLLRVLGRVLRLRMVKSTTTTRKPVKPNGKSRQVCPSTKAPISGYPKSRQPVRKPLLPCWNSLCLKLPCPAPVLLDDLLRADLSDLTLLS